MSAPQPSLQLDAALQARDRGWRPFPLDHPDLPECVGVPAGHPCQPKDRGKHPAVAWATATATEPPERLLRHWWSQGPRNVGIACGPSGLVVVDEDELDALERYAHDHREKLPKTYRVQTSRGWHWYFDVTDLDVVIGNTPGLLETYGCDVRGGKGAGGYVAAAGSVHHTGHVYIAEDPYLVPHRPPDWLVSAWLTKPVAGPAAAQTMSASPLVDGFVPTGGWTDLPRYGTTDQLLAQYLRHLDAVQGRGDAFRHSLYLAALDGWRLVDCGVIDQARMFSDLRGRVFAVWGAAPDERDRHIVSVEARNKASESPWVVIDAVPSVTVSHGTEIAVTHSERAVDVVEASTVPVPRTSEELYQLQLNAELQRERLRRDARRALAEEEDDTQLISDAARRLRVQEAARALVASEGQPPIATQSTGAFLEPAPVDYLMEGMFHA